MPVDNDSDSGTSYTVARPRPNAPSPTTVAAAVVTAIAVAAQLVQFNRAGGSTLQTIALVSSIVALGVLVFQIVQAGASKDVYYDVVCDPVELHRGATGGFLHPDIAADWIILFQDPESSAFQATASGIPNATKTVHLQNNLTAVGAPGDPPFSCTLT
ncbi:MAG TPA: hypothetical protein VN783_08970 [Thermoanaerobaculia bacterium]|nr:hypothetical protein [Thermoanaerobaculia bacterium]